MAIQLAALEKTAKAISSLGYEEISFAINGTEITLCTLTPEQEIEVQRYASQVYKDNASTDASDTMDFFDRFRVATIAKGCCQLGEHDLRGVTTVETGETTSAGKPIKSPKDQVLIKLFTKWPRNLVIGCFSKHFEITFRRDSQTREAIQFEPSDLDAEISRLQDRIKMLENEKERRKSHEQNLFMTFYKETHRVGQNQVNEAPSSLNEDDGDIADYEEDEDDVVEAPAPVAAPPTQRRSIIPTQSAPPPRPGQAEMPPLPLQAPPHTPPVQYQKPGSANTPASFEAIESSLVDTGDADSMEAAMQAEVQRFYAARQAPLGGVTLPQGSEPPVQEINDASSLKRAQFEGTTKDGKEVYRLPSESLTGAPVELTRPQVPTQAQEALNPPRGGIRNPRFQSRK